MNVLQQEQNNFEGSGLAFRRSKRPQIEAETERNAKRQGEASKSNTKTKKSEARAAQERLDHLIADEERSVLDAEEEAKNVPGLLPERCWRRRGAERAPENDEKKTRDCKGGVKQNTCFTFGNY